MNPAGGAAIPISIDTTRKVQGGAAIPVYGYASAPTDGRPAMAGPAQPVRVLTAADLKQNGGQWTVEGRPYAMPVYTAPAGTTVMGGPALAVYPVNAWPPSSTPPVVTPWYLAGGISAANCVAAYQPKGAASLAASYSNLANPGTNDAAPGVAPTFNAATGWTFNGSTQYLTSVTPADGWSIFIQYTNLAAVDSISLIGCYKDSAPDGAWLIQRQTADGMHARAGALTNEAVNAPVLAAGNYGFAGKTAYRNGAAEPNAITAGTGTGTPLYIGALDYNNGTAIQFAGLEVCAVAIYSATITGPQALALATAMAAL